MIAALLYRDKCSAIATQGIFIIDNNLFYTIELPYKNNLPNVSCIKSGDYLCTFCELSNNKKFKDCYRIHEVPDRSGILLHNGNTTHDTEGCIIVGKKRGVFLNAPAVLQSRSALSDIVSILDKKDFILKII